jgi:hypothetical protein
MGPRQFGREVREFFDRMWPTATVGELWGDPAGFYGGGYGGEAAEDLAWMQEFGRTFGKKVKPSPVKGNRVTPRIEAVRACLTTNVGNRPGMLISPIAKHLRRGFNNGYVIQRLSFSDGSGRYKDAPHKNDFSHVHDAAAISRARHQEARQRDSTKWTRQPARPPPARQCRFRARLFFRRRRLGQASAPHAPPQERVK